MMKRYFIALLAVVRLRVSLALDGCLQDSMMAAAPLARIAGSFDQSYAVVGREGAVYTGVLSAQDYGVDNTTTPAVARDMGLQRRAASVAMSFGEWACALLDTGAVRCSTPFDEDVYLGPGRTAIQIGVGFQLGCALLSDYTVVCWVLRILKGNKA
jgi:hypothetical protein